MRVVRYGPQHKTAWNAAIRSSRNGTFLFCRDYLDYHSLEEITLLHSRFPANIRLLAAFEDQAMTAGVVIYESDRVARTQYIAADSRGRVSGSLDLLVSTLIHQVFVDKPFVEFGTSDECNGRQINQGLIEYKEGFGARSVAHDHYRIDLGRPVRCRQSLSNGRPPSSSDL